jgi:hypothetical protein
MSLNNELAMIDDEYATNPELEVFFDRNKNAWVSYTSMSCEAYSKPARVIGNISRGFFNKNAIDKFLCWENPNKSLVGISGTIEAYNVACFVSNEKAKDYLKQLIPSDYTKESYYQEWKMSYYKTMEI